MPQQRFYKVPQEGHEMGKGDKRTRRGKIFKGSYGRTRPHKKKEKAKKPAPAR